MTQVWYRFVIQLGLLPLNGTTSEAHMIADLAVLTWDDQPLTEQDMRDIGSLIGESV
jgi:diketogulonate reductase-like aldo/keto reductase